MKNEFKLGGYYPALHGRYPSRIYMDLMPVKFYKKSPSRMGKQVCCILICTTKEGWPRAPIIFWNYGREVTCKIFNMKIQQLDISGQEILTADKAGHPPEPGGKLPDHQSGKLVEKVDGVSGLPTPEPSCCLRNR